jgi:hypothetical protein
MVQATILLLLLLSPSPSIPLKAVHGFQTSQAIMFLPLGDGPRIII